METLTEIGLLAIIASPVLLFITVGWWVPNVARKSLQKLLNSRTPTQNKDDTTNRIYEVLAEVVADVTGVTVAPDLLRHSDRLGSDLKLNLDSLAVIQLESALSKEFGVEFRMPRHYQHEPTVNSLLQLVQADLNSNPLKK